MKALKRNWNESLKMQRQTNKQKFVEKIIPGMNAAVDPHVQDTVPLEKNQEKDHSEQVPVYEAESKEETFLQQDKFDKDGYKIKSEKEMTSEWKEWEEEVLRSHMVEVPHKDTVEDIRRNLEMALSYKEQATIEQKAKNFQEAFDY